MESATKNIPKNLIYEMIDGKPIYYKGYKQFLSGENKTQEPMGSSLLQSMIISNLVILLHSKIGKNHYILTNELGLQFSKGNWRAADIAIYEKSQIDLSKIDNKYTKIPPKIVIEIDTKAEIADIKDTFSYYNQKTDQLLNFGVEKVIWIFTDTRKVLIAEKDKNWQILNWSKDINIMEGVDINVDKIIS